MASSKCPSCPSTSFELKEIIPSGSKYKMFSVQCSNCGSVVGILEYTNTEYLIDQQSNEIKELRNYLDIINQNMRTIIGQLNNK